MKLEAFSEVSNLVRHLEGLEARREQIASAHAKGVNSFLIELRKFNDDGGYYDCHAYMQAHDDAAAITVEELFEVLRVHVASKIEGVKAKLRDLGVNVESINSGDNDASQPDGGWSFPGAKYASDLQNIESPSRVPEALSGK